MFNTFEQMNQLVAGGYATVKTEGNYSIFKYHRKVMFEYLWDKVPGILECRGHVYNNTTGELVQAPPRKSFNFLENLWWCQHDHTDRMVYIYKKYNGYMVAASKVDGKLMVSTTGSLSSDYVAFARPFVEKWFERETSNATYIFEMVDKTFDPHIVDDPDGLHLLGYRYKDSGTFVPTGRVAKVTLGEALEIARKDRGEGFMIYNQFDTTNTAPAKLKTPYYVGKKMLMRLNKANTKALWDGKLPERMPEMWKKCAILYQSVSIKKRGICCQNKIADYF